MFLIRADGNAQIGAGHLMRCISAAEELAELAGRENICFVCADGQSAKLAQDYGFHSRVLGTDYRNMESELPLWRGLAAELSPPEEGLVLLVDSYYVTDKYLAALGEFGYTVLMEDFGTHCYPVDCVINYNAPADREAYERLYQGRNVSLLIGSSYVPLRRQFKELLKFDGQTLDADKENAPAYTIRDRVQDVLITTGGGDSGDIAGAILEMLYTGEKTGDIVSGMEFHVITGRFGRNADEASEADGRRIHFYHNVKNMAEMMGRCDMALTAGGSTIYELAAAGVPFICFSYAENQELLTEYIGKKHIAGFAGAWHKDSGGTLERMGELFKELAGSREKRAGYSKKEKAMVDGLGAERLANALMRLKDGIFTQV